MSTTKIKMPLLTKLAIGWLVTFGIYFVVGGALSTIVQTFIQTVFPFADYDNSLILLMPALGVFGSFVPIILLYTVRKSAWKIAVILLFVEQALALILSLVFSNVSLLIFLVIFFVPFILVVLDQQKYFAMLRQQELAKNKDTTPTVEP